MLAWLAAAAFSTAIACSAGKPFTSSSSNSNTGGDSATPAGGEAAGGQDALPFAGAQSGGPLSEAGSPSNTGTAGMDSSSAGQTAGGAADSGPLGCAEACVDPKPYCADVKGVPTCTNPAQALSGKRLELACVTGSDAVAQLCESVADRATNCPKTGKLDKKVIPIEGDPNALYSVKLHVRGVVEPRTYVGGKDAGNHFYVGGTGQQPSNYNTFSVIVSSPAQTFYLNADTKPESYRVFTLDHEESIVVAGNATVTLQVLDPDCAMVKNCQSAGAATCVPYVVDGVPPAPKAFNGQFVQLDVVSVTRAP